MKIGKYMTAEVVGLREPDAYLVRDSRGADLGLIEWYPRREQYVFQPDHGAVFSSDCLRSLAMFLSKCKNHQARRDRQPSAAELTDLQGLDIHEQ